MAAAIGQGWIDGLQRHARRLDGGTTLSALLRDDPARAEDFSLRLGPLYANFARQSYDREALEALFALARTVGWVAQWNEMISDPEQKIGRPRQLYTGAAQRDYVPCDKR